MNGKLADAYKSGSQKARVVSEDWGIHNLYCPHCPSDMLERLRNNSKVSDFLCPECEFLYQLKSRKSRIGNSIMGSNYRAMMDAIQNDRLPNFYLMQYELVTWSVKNLLLIPNYAFPPSAIIPRKPLSTKAKRRGWVGYIINLNCIPLEARINVIVDSSIVQADIVRRKYYRSVKLKEIAAGDTRGWALDVLRCVEKLGKKEFTTQEMYQFEGHLGLLHPDNRHVKDKIRQQLQVLRDKGLLEFSSRGNYRLA